MVGNFKGFGREATIKLSSSLTPKNQIALWQFSWWARKQKALSIHVKAMHFCSASLHQCSGHTFSADHAVPAGLQCSPPCHAMPQCPPAFTQECRKVEDFLQWFLKTRLPGEDQQITLCHLIQRKAQGNPRNDCFSVLWSLKDIQTPWQSKWDRQVSLQQSCQTDSKGRNALL